MNLIDLLLKAMAQVLTTLQHNWALLLVSVLVGTAMKLYVKTDAVAGFMRRNEKRGVLAATATAVATPLCSCGSTAVVLGMMAATPSAVPWAPIVAFMVASPLTSPEGLFYSAGIFGWPFAGAFFVASILLGLLGGMAAVVLDGRGWLRNQARLVTAGETGTRTNADERGGFSLLPERVLNQGMTSCGCATQAQLLPTFVLSPQPCGCAGQAAAAPAIGPVATGCGCGSNQTGTSHVAGAAAANSTKFEIVPFLREAADMGRRLLVLFLAFATIGYLINDLIPTAWITALFGSGHAYSVPLAATLGLPFYINSEASLPLVRGMLSAGMSSGAALAFLITGAGTSIGAIAGALTIARWRVLGLVIGTLWVGAVLCGLGYDALLTARLF